MPRTKNKIPEGKLLKALAELEDSVAKGDTLQERDPEGGLSAEGKPLSDKAPRGKSDAKKSEAQDDDEDEEDTAKAFSASDMGSDDESSDASSEDDAPPPSLKKTKKSFPPPKAKKDDDSSSDDDAEKSLRAAADQDETMSKAIEVSDFLEAMVDQLSLTMLNMTKSFQTAIADMEGRINARIDSRVSKGIALSQDFNGRLAKAISAIGTSVEEQADLVKSFGNQPAVAPRGKAVLVKSDVNQPPWSAGGHASMADGSDADFGDLTGVPVEKIGDWLFAKSARNQIDPRLIMAWEANRYDVTTLPEEIQKSLANDLLK